MNNSYVSSTKFARYCYNWYVALVEVDTVKLKELRSQNVLTLAELSDKSGVTLNTIWRIESGYSKSARPSTVRKLATALGVEPGELVKAS